MGLQSNLKSLHKKVLSSYIESSDAFSIIKVGDPVLVFVRGGRATHESADDVRFQGRWTEAVVSAVIEQFEDGGCLCTVLPKLKQGLMGTARKHMWRPGLPYAVDGEKYVVWTNRIKPLNEISTN